MTGRPCSLVLAAFCTAASGAGFDEIDYWIGEGAHRSALVIDWDESVGEGPSLAWGLYWDVPPTGEELLRAVLAADPRAVGKLTDFGQLGGAVYGLGYDFNGDGSLDLSDGTPFPNGVASEQDSAPIDTLPEFAAVAIDPLDVYAEGLLTAGFWHYTVSPDPGAADLTWTSSGAGASTRVLADGEWDGWTFTPYLHEDGSVKQFEELFLTSPDSPIGAPAPTEPGDYNRDGFVDAADYTAWRETDGLSEVIPGSGADGDFSGVVDTNDHQLWRNHYGQGPAAVSIPEPTAGLLTLTCFLLFQPANWRD